MSLYMDLPSSALTGPLYRTSAASAPPPADWIVSDQIPFRPRASHLCNSAHQPRPSGAREARGGSMAWHEAADVRVDGRATAPALLACRRLSLAAHDLLSLASAR